MSILRLAVLSLVAAGLIASEVVPPPGPMPPPTIKLPPEEQPIRLTELAVAVTVSGLQAETVTTMTFRNPNNRVLAGELEFPLPDGATVCGYALDVNGRMVDGVIVPKDKGRVVMETEMRRQVDPGLVEHVRGNLFRTRVYPIPAQGTRTIRVVHVAELALAADGAACHVPLPRTELPQLKLRVEVKAGGGEPELGGFGDLVLQDFSQRWVAEAELGAVTPDDDLYIRLPRLGSELVTLEHHHRDATFAAISHAPDLPEPRTASKPARIAVAWDASGSRDPEAVARDRAVLAALVARAGCGVDLRVFRNAPAPWQHFAPGADGARALAAHLDALAYDGGTDLAALDLRGGALPAAAASVDRWILFTDGLHTLGAGLPGIGEMPVHVVASGSRRDRGVQRFIAAATGGQLVDAARSPAEAVAQSLLTVRPTLLRVEAPAGALGDIQHRFAVEAGRATVYARVLADCEATLVYGYPGGAVVLRHSVQLRQADGSIGRVIGRAWAGAKVAELAVFSERNADEILRLGRQYGLVTPGTSLIVLENLRQYLEHEIEPPVSWHSMRERYLAALKQRRQQEEARVTDKLAIVLDWWRDRAAWWERDFPHHAEVKVAQADDDGTAVPVAGEQEAAGLTAAFGSLARRLTGTVVGARESSAHGGFVLPADALSADATLEGEESTAKAEVIAPSTAASIAIQPWDPDTPYLAALREAPPTEVYPAYLAQRAEHASSPAFFLDCAGPILAQDRALGLRVLSNLAELKIDDPALLRVYAWRLEQAGALDRAIELLERVRRLRAEDPQSHRDLALLLARRGEQDETLGDLTRAVRLLYDVVVGEWQRFEQIEVIALMELNRYVALATELPGGEAADFGYIDSRLRKLLDCDVRILLRWDADNTDIDLHVIEPSGEEAYYGNNRTTIGGLVSRDFTQGYGPEEYLLRRAMPGTYRIRCRYFGSSQQTLVGPATVTATVITNFGRPDEHRRDLTLRLEDVKETVDIGAITIGAGAASPATGATITRERLGSLHRGMSRAAVEAALGPSERVDGDGLSVLVYRLADGVSVRLGFGPDLLWAREIHAGAERALPLAPAPEAAD